MLSLSTARLIGLVVFAGLYAAQPGVAQDAFSLTIRNHRFEPTRLEIPANTKVKVVIKNADSSEEEFESLELRREKVVAPGEEVTVYVGPLSPGVYPFFGDFHPDTAKGELVAR